MKECVKLFSALAATIIVLVLFATTNATTRCVNPDGSGGCDDVIQTVINASVNGDTILIHPGTYAQSITLNRSVIIRGLGSPCEVNLYPPTGNAVIMTSAGHNSNIQNLTITAMGGHGIYSVVTATLHIYNCIIQYCGGTGIYCPFNSYYTPTVYVTNCIIRNNTGRGVYSTSYSNYYSTIYLYNNIIIQNHDAGIYYDNGPNYHNENNCVYDNNPNYGGNSIPGPADIQANPLIISADSCNFHLQLGSPCIDNGRRGQAYNDCDGSFNDMGIYGGPYSWCGPGPVVTDLQILPDSVFQDGYFRIQASGATR